MPAYLMHYLTCLEGSDEVTSIKINLGFEKVEGFGEIVAWVSWGGVG